MITEAKFKLALKDMMRTKKLEDINVTALCKKCDVHRQTFYYHYQDLYDLIAAIFLSEDLSATDSCHDVLGILGVFTNYVSENFSFLRSTYNSAARDLTDDFIYGKLNAALFALWSERGNEEKLDKESSRIAARLFSHFVSEEYGHCFKDQDLTPLAFETSMRRFNEESAKTVLPSMIALAKKLASHANRGAR